MFGPLTARAALLLALGGTLGTFARFLVGAALARPGFPWSTLAINVVGSAALGFLVAGGLLVREEWRLFVAVGFLGAFTTMSAFAVETVALAAEGDPVAAALNLLANPLASVAGAAMGWAAGRAWAPM